MKLNEVNKCHRYKKELLRPRMTKTTIHKTDLIQSLMSPNFFYKTY